MRKVLLPLLTILISTLFFFPVPSSAQTLSLNDGSITQSKTTRIGMNIGAINYWDNGEVLKNLVGSINPDFEPLTTKQIWSLTSAGTSTGFTNGNMYDPVPQNYWAGATFTIVASQTNNGQQGCTGTIASNTGAVQITSVSRSGGYVTVTTSTPSGYVAGNSISVQGVADTSYNGYPVGTILSVSGDSIVFAQAGANSTSTGGIADQIAPPTYTTSTTCGGPFSVGDIVILSEVSTTTPESWWESSKGGTWAQIAGGGKLTSDNTDLCATCGTQALTLNAAASGSMAGATWYFDGGMVGTPNNFVLMNGTYQISFWAKAASGTPTLSIRAGRGSKGGFSCGAYTQTPTSTWTQYTFTCTASETAAGTAVGTSYLAVATTGGAAYLDNVSFEKNGSTQPSVFRDEVINTLSTFNPGALRYWVNQNGESIDNWTRPDYARAPTGSGIGYQVGPGGSNVVSLSLEDYLVICQILNTEPYLEVPVTFSPEDAEGLIEFLAGSSSSTYGARRVALGQAEPWTTVFSKIHLSYCNECWNSLSFSGQNLPARASAPNDKNCPWVCPNNYYDYSVQAAATFAAMRSAPDYTSAPFDLVMNLLTPGDFLADSAIASVKPDSVEIQDYTYSSVSDYSSDQALWQPAFVEAYDRVVDPNDPTGVYTSMNDYPNKSICGASGTTLCNLNIYEWADSTSEGSVDQQHLDYVTAGAGQGIVAALEPLLNLQYYGIQNQNYFGLTELYNGGPNGELSKMWGSVVDMGGSTNNVRPQFLAMSLVNQSIIGPMFACPIANNATFNFAGSALNGTAVSPGVPALKNVPYLYSFCFQNGRSRSLVLVNTDLTNSHTVNLTGSNPPSGAVNVRQYAPSSPDDLNEAPTGTATNLTQAVVSIVTDTLSSPNSITLPPDSVTALDYTAASNADAAMPVFSVSSGTYTIAQQVTMSDATSGTTIYYTTDGSTPTTSSNAYTGAITISASETLNAIAVGTGYSSSPDASATYTINNFLSPPTISLASGIYTTAQAVTMTSAGAGTTIYYTTNGSTPTIASSVYTGLVTVSATETLNAIVAGTGYVTSSVATAAYSIQPVLHAPTFTPAIGVYTTAQTVSILDSTPGTTIYYTTNGTTPTAGSTVYSTPIVVSATETIEATAVENGYTQSPVATATFTISAGSVININYAAGGFTSSKFALEGGPTVTSGMLQLTDGNGGEARSAWYTTKVPVQQFITDFTFQQLNATADGMTFAIEGDAVWPYGGNGAALGYEGIAKSIAVKFDLYNNSGEGSDSTGLYTNGAMPTIPSTDLSSTGINFHSGDVMYAHMVYDGTNLTMTITDAVTSATVTEVFPVNIPSIVGGNTAYVGFTGGTGGFGAKQNVLTWSYVTPSTATATPIFSIAPGTYATAQTVTISDATAAAAIYYTTDGSVPTTASSKYSGAIAVNATETLNTIAVSSGLSNSTVATAAYTISPVLPTPVFSLAAGTFTTTQSVSISESNAAAAIYYTLDGSTPTAASNKYSGIITVSATETLNAVAIATNYTNSTIASAVYTINPVLPTPVFSLAAGTFTTAQSVSISESNAAAAIYYTLDGSTPTAASSLYAGAITVSATETVNAIAIATNYTNSTMASAVYTINPVLPTPVFGLAAGTFTTAQSVSIGDSNSSASIYYTLDGSTPTAASNRYAGVITISATETVNAIAIATNYTNSAVTSAVYTINPVLPTPVFSLAAATFTTTQYVSISESNAAAAIYYTLDGSTPTAASNMYAGAITVSATETVNAIAVATNYTNSIVASAVYTINPVLPTPSFSMAAGTFTTAQSVSISEGNPAASIYYTLDGSTPTAASNKYMGAFTVSATETLNAIAVATNYTNSAVASAVYTINPVLPTPSFSMAAGTFTVAQSVSISDSNAAAAIYYTLDGSTPTAASNMYAGAITVSATETLDAIAVAANYTNSNVASAVYIISPVLPMPAFSVPGGTFSNAQTVTISAATSSPAPLSFAVAHVARLAASAAVTSSFATIYYTTDGSTPTTASAIYTGPITVSGTETLQAIAVATGYTNSPVAAAAFTINSLLINYPSDGFATGGMVLNGGSTVTEGALELTDGGGTEARSAWFNTKMPVTSFVSDFTFQINGLADGMTFAIQGSSKGTSALGADGNALGYGGIKNSVALKFDIHNNAGEGSDSTGVYLGGATPTIPAINLAPTGITLASNDLLDAHLVYDGTTLTLTLTDTQTGVVTTQQFLVNIPSIVGGSTAYVGFTAGTGAHSAVQQVESWTYSAL